MSRCRDVEIVGCLEKVGCREIGGVEMSRSGVSWCRDVEIGGVLM